MKDNLTRMENLKREILENEVLLLKQQEEAAALDARTPTEAQLHHRLDELERRIARAVGEGEAEVVVAPARVPAEAEAVEAAPARVPAEAEAAPAAAAQGGLYTGLVKDWGALGEAVPAVPTAPKPGLAGLRPVRLPPAMISEFLGRAEANSARDVETCGWIAGSLVAGKYVATALVLAKQEGTANSCTTLDEVEVLEFLSKEELVILGWIHTHPSQTAFLSSVDLHMQCSYQSMLPEAIAVVCSIKYADTQIFRLTTPRGLQTISACTQSGFHPHDEPREELFEVCSHVLPDPSVQWVCRDFRT